MPLGIQFPLGNSQASGLGTGGVITGALTATFIPVATGGGTLANSNMSVDAAVTTLSILNFGATAVDPVSANNGDWWLNTDSWKYKSNGTIKTISINAGVIDASTAAAGDKGEVLTANVTTQALGADNVAGNLVTLALTPGEWLIEASATLAGGATGFTANTLVSLSLNTTSATQNPAAYLVSADTIQALEANGSKGMRAPLLHLSVNANTNVYLVCTARYGAGAPTAAAQIVAQRIR